MTDKSNRTPDHDDDVAALVRLAGQRPPIPEDREERVRHAARATWLQETRRRSRSRLLWGGAALAVAASLVVAVIGLMRTPGEGSGEETAGVGGSLPVELEAGRARIRELSGGALAEVREMSRSEEIPAGSVLSTEAGHRAAVRLASGHSLRLDEDTAVRLDDAGTLRLGRGAIYLSSPGDGRSGGTLHVVTPLGALREIGTQFAVRLTAGGVRIRVREGAVVMQGPGEDREVRTGTEMVVLPDGSATTRAIPTHGAPWEWIAGVTPMIDLQGRSARSFLDWVARERGWALSFADEDLARSAETILVAGDIRGMTVEQALDAVLPSCRMAHRLEGGTLEIRTLP